MARRVGPGPVFIYESLIFARRRQLYAGRVLFVLAMLAGLWISWWNNLDTPGPGQPPGSRPGTLQALSRAGSSFFYALAGIQLSMMLLVAPAATAGALCQDRARGILAQMAATDLSDSEIVLGKLFSRLAPTPGAPGLRPAGGLARGAPGRHRRRGARGAFRRLGGRRGPRLLRWRSRSPSRSSRPTRSSWPCSRSSLAGC